MIRHQHEHFVDNVAAFEPFEQEYFFHSYVYDYTTFIAFCKYLSKARFKMTQIPNKRNYSICMIKH